MNAAEARWQRVNALFHAALRRAPGDRDAFLSAECSDDAGLRPEVQSLLNAHDDSQTSGFSATVRVGFRIGDYEVTGFIAKGGMGEVYRARDSRLKRNVALKILPESFQADPEHVARFQREAEVLASLNHPHIAAIYGLEDAGGTRALILELVEGDTLADRIAHGPIPLDEALPIARQIAEALEAAHEQGIIHRDLKPANIKITPDGVVKVLDFGLAKLANSAGSGQPAAGGADMSRSPTITSPAMMTGIGMLLGTAAYMSPEQAKGKPADKRSDIWAFGAVLFEMLTGRRAFVGDEVSDVLASVLAREPDFALLPATLSPALGTFVKRCLHKNPKQRIADVQDIRLALEGAFETVAPPMTAMPSSSTPRGRLALMATLAVAAVAIVAMAIFTVRDLLETSPPETRVDIVTPATDRLADFALSPDGRQIVFVASGNGASRLWLRSLTTTTVQPLAGTEGATLPFWSPDSHSIGFFAAGALKRLDLGGGAPRTLAAVGSGQGGTWNADGVIVFAPATTTPLMRVSATGGTVAAVTALGPQQLNHRLPHLLPDGRQFLFYVAGVADTAGIYLGALDGRAPTQLTAGGRGDNSAGVYLPAGWLLWVRAGTLVAQRLDVAKAALTGEPVTLADGVHVTLAKGPVSVAATGLVAYRTGGDDQRQLTWMDRSGTARGTIGDPDATLSTPRVSPDGRRVAVERTVQDNRDLWILDGARMSRFTFDPAQDSYPAWSPEGTRIAFRSTRVGALGDLYQKLTSGAGVEDRLGASDQQKTPSSWSADGHFLLYYSADPQRGADLWVLPVAMAGDRTPSLFLKTSFREAWGAFSPNGRWVAYESNESGRMEIYVRPFVPPGATGTTAGGQWQVSTAGGAFPLWRPDGKELYYLDPAGAMMAVPITVTGATPEPGAPMMLFPTRIYGGGLDIQQGRQYDVAPDGRFLINTALDSATAPITLLQNWNPELKK